VSDLIRRQLALLLRSTTYALLGTAEMWFVAAFFHTYLGGR